jgi:thiamine pyrophosphate-dependent acetolactate synthase large subunit-like protein
MAEAIGIRGIRVEKPAGLEAAVGEALAHDGPVLLDVVDGETGTRHAATKRVSASYMIDTTLQAP